MKASSNQPISVRDICIYILEKNRRLHRMTCNRVSDRPFALRTKKYYVDKFSYSRTSEH